MSANILIVEDEPAVQELLKASLSRGGFKVASASDAAQARASIRDALPDVVILDWMMPGETGISLAHALRNDRRTRDLPIIMLTARAAETDKVSGLDTGADDYITKPFSPRELVARVNALLRRRAPEHSDQVLKVGPLVLDPAARTASVGGREIDLGPTEFNLLKFLMAHPGRVHSRKQLLDQVWGDHIFIEERTVDVQIRRLRVALGENAENLIETVRGAGYKLAFRS
jgi:two-component system phosphate regulon response regulator PhoB